MSASPIIHASRNPHWKQYCAIGQLKGMAALLDHVKPQFPNVDFHCLEAEIQAVLKTCQFAIPHAKEGDRDGTA